MFEDAFLRRRAIVPADVYYQHGMVGRAAGTRFAISRSDKEPMAWAGLWEGYRAPDGQITRSYCVITVDATGPVAAIHDRMPLMLAKDDWAGWLGEQEAEVAALLTPRFVDLLVCRPTR